MSQHNKAVRLAEGKKMAQVVVLGRDSPRHCVERNGAQVLGLRQGHLRCLPHRSQSHLAEYGIQNRPSNGDEKLTPIFLCAVK